MEIDPTNDVFSNIKQRRTQVCRPIYSDMKCNGMPYMNKCWLPTTRPYINIRIYVLFK